MTGRWKSDDAKYIRGAIFTDSHIYLAFDCTFPSQADGKVMALNAYDMIVSYDLSYIFSTRLHFPLAGRRKSDGAKGHTMCQFLNGISI